MKTFFLKKIGKAFFFKYIYLISYNIFFKHYLTSFAVKQDFFHTFFDSEKNDLNQ